MGETHRRISDGTRRSGDRRRGLRDGVAIDQAGGERHCDDAGEHRHRQHDADSSSVEPTVGEPRRQIGHLNAVEQEQAGVDRRQADSEGVTWGLKQANHGAMFHLGAAAA